VNGLWRTAVVEKSAVSTDYRLRHVSGEWHWTTVRAVPLVTADSVSGWVGMNLDITERKEAEAQPRSAAA
jgi:PAS domain S-box-containing protein